MKFTVRSNKSVSRTYPWRVDSNPFEPGEHQWFSSRREARIYCTLRNFCVNQSIAIGAYAGTYPLECKNQRWYDVLANGRIVATLFAHTPELALAQALESGIKFGRAKITVVARVQNL